VRVPNVEKVSKHFSAVESFSGRLARPAPKKKGSKRCGGKKVLPKTSSQRAAPPFLPLFHKPQRDFLCASFWPVPPPPTRRAFGP
jgi:hypothetical protein